MDEESGQSNTKKPHSVKVPRLYKVAAKSLDLIENHGEGLKNAVYSVKHPNVKAITALVSEALKHDEMLTTLITKSKIVENEVALSRQLPLVKILITELVWGKQRLVNDSKPIQTILKYHEKFQKVIAKVERRSKNKDAEVAPIEVIKKPRYVRVNTLKMPFSDALDYLVEDGWDLKEGIEDYGLLSSGDIVVDTFVDNLLVFGHGAELYHHPLYRNGSFVLQDKASCLPAMALKPRRGREVLDACAAPGMKTSFLSASMNNEGTLFAVEKNTKRFNTLKEILESLGVSNAKTINANFTDLDPNDYPEVEYILVDPSCSGSGMFGRLDSQLKQNSTTADRIAALSHCQKMLLLHAMKFPKVKRIVYSTCSIYSEENEDVVAAALQFCQSFQVKNTLPSWPHRLSNPNYPWSELCVKSDLESDYTDGFFVCTLERCKERKKSIKKETEDNNHA